jgi:hypothetical protein
VFISHYYTDVSVQHCTIHSEKNGQFKITLFEARIFGSKHIKLTKFYCWWNFKPYYGRIVDGNSDLLKTTKLMKAFAVLL